MEKGLAYLKETFELEYQDIRTYSPLTLAYIGDAIYELVIRTILVEKGNTQVNKLHKRASRLVKASAQSAMIEKLKPYLTEEEMSVFKRGRNAKAATMAKNATMSDYRRATGFEALMGYLYLTEQWERMLELMKTGIREVEQDGENNPGK
nr:ribonuclease III domain-containing protein [uncultured Blautia sp.]